LKLRVEMLLSENARIKDAHDKEKVIILRWIWYFCSSRYYWSPVLHCLGNDAR
jgi:hypothetical protein